MNKLSGTILGGILAVTMSGCPNPTPGQQKALDILGCFGGTVTSAVEDFVAMLLTDAFKGVSPDWQTAADGLIAKGEGDALPDIGCAITKALGQAYSPKPGAAVDPAFVKGLNARVKYIEDKLKLRFNIEKQ